MWTQIVGKTRLALAPMENHWWQVPLYVTARGLTTSPMPSRGVTVAVDFDFIDHRLDIRTSDGTGQTLPLVRQSVADFYGAYMHALRAVGHPVQIRPVPVEIERAIPFAEDREHASYDPEAANRWWRAVVQADRVMKRLRGAFLGKSSPVHFWWGAFDLAVTRFSGRTAPRHGGGIANCPDYVMWEAYSRECASFGFWPGGPGLEEPAFYAYAYPAPAGYRDCAPGVSAAYYHHELGEFILPYEAVRTAPEPERMVLAFFQSAYAAAADLGRWDRVALER